MNGLSGNRVQYHAGEQLRIGVESVFGQTKTIKETIVLTTGLTVCNPENVENRVAQVSSKFSLWVYLFLKFKDMNKRIF